MDSTTSDATAQVDVSAGYPRGATVRNAVIVAGGYLFLLFLAAVRRQDLANAGAVITISALAVLGGVAIAVLGAVLRGSLQVSFVFGLSYFLLLLSLSLSWQMAMVPGLHVLYGSGSVSMGLAFLVLVFALGLTCARRRAPDNVLLRVLLGAASGVSALLYCVHILVVLAEGGASTLALGQIFRSGDPVLIIFCVLFLLLVGGIIGVTIGAAATTRRVDTCTRVALGLTWGILGLLVGFTALHFLLAVVSDLSQLGNHLLALVVSLMAGIGPLFGVAQLAIGSTGLLAVALSARLASLQADMRSAAQPAQVPQQMEAPPSAEASTPPERPEPDAAPATAAPSSPDDGSGGIAAKLRELKEWHEQGLIDKDEYDAKRRDLLERM